MVGAGTGAAAGGSPGAMIGDLVPDSVFQEGKSGTVKVGISATEKIVLPPEGASANLGLLARFLKAKRAGQTAAMTSAYNALKVELESADRVKRGILLKTRDCRQSAILSWSMGDCDLKLPSGQK